MNRLKLLATAVLAVLCAAAWSMCAHPWGWLYGIGVHPYPGPQTPWTYQLLSGFLPALTVLSVVTLLVGGWHHVNCHQDGCYRIGKHKIDGTPWCNAHHEQARPQLSDHHLLEQILDALNSSNALLREIKGQQ